MAKIPGHNYDQMLAPLDTLGWNAAHDLKTELEAIRFPTANRLIDTPAADASRYNELKEELGKIGQAQARINAHIAGLAAKRTLERP
jgi:hypothetical protein